MWNLIRRVGLAALMTGWVFLAPKILASGAYGEWTNASLGGGGYLQNLVRAGDGVFMTYSDVGGAWRSADQGRTWRLITGGLPKGDGYLSVRGLIPAGDGSDHLVIGVGNQWSGNRGVFISRDGGITWEKRLDVRFLGNEEHRSAGFVLQRVGHSIVAGTAGDGVWISHNGGADWQLLGLQGKNITDLDRAADGTLFACAKDFTFGNGSKLDGGFYRLQAGKTDWEVFESSPQEIVTDSSGNLVGIFESARILRSTDGGATWGDFSSGLPIDEAASTSYTSESRFRALAAGHGFFVVVSSRGSVYRRGESDPSWVRISRAGVVEEFEGAPWWGRIQPGKWQHFGGAAGSLTIDPQDPNRWWMTDWYGLYESTNSGLNWTLRVDGIESTVVHCVGGLRNQPKGILAGLADVGPVYSRNGGGRFEAPLAFSNLKAWQESEAGVVFAVGSASGEWRASTLWKSTDSGASWTKPPASGLPAFTNRSMNSIAVTGGAPQSIYLALSKSPLEGGGIYRSLDAGVTFQSLNNGLPHDISLFREDIWGRGSELAATASGAVIAISSSRSTVYRFAKAQSRWEPVTGLVGEPLSVAAAGDTLYVAMGSGGILRSTDQGLTWSSFLAGFCGLIGVDSGNSSRVAALVPSGISWTTDEGALWHSIQIPPNGEIRALGFSGDRLLAGTDGNGIFHTSSRETPRPYFHRDSFVGLSVRFGSPYRSTIAGSAASTKNGTLSFSKSSGPNWLVVSANGTLTGTPGAGVIGLNRFVIVATGSNGASVSANLEIEVQKNLQTLGQLAAPANRNFSSTPISVSLPKASSGLPVVLSVKSGPATLSGNAVVPNSVGTIILAANQPGNATFSAAPEVTASFIIRKIPQTITPISRIANQAVGAPPLKLTPPSASSGLPVTLSVKSGPATIADNVLTMSGSGNVVLAANQLGNATISAAPEVTISFSVVKLAQTIQVFPNYPRQNQGTSLTITSPVASSGLPVQVSVKSGNATLTGNVLAFSSPGSVVLSAKQPGNALFYGVEILGSITVGKPLATLQVDTPDSSKGTITPGFAGTSQRELGLTYTMTATPASGMRFVEWRRNGVKFATEPRVTFAMNANLQWAAVFAPNFAILGGTYAGSIGDGEVGAGGSAEQAVFASRNGFVDLTLSTTGAFTGRVVLDGVPASFTGNFVTGNTVSLTVPRTGKPTLTLNLRLSAALPGEVAGSVYNGQESLPVLLRRTAYRGSLANHPLSGQIHSLVFTDAPSEGYRFGRLVTTSIGTARLEVFLETGETLIFNGGFSDGGDGLWVFPFHIPMANGLFQGECVVSKSSPQSVGGSAEWLRTGTGNHLWAMNVDGMRMTVSAGKSLVTGNGTTAGFRVHLPDGNGTVLVQGQWPASNKPTFTTPEVPSFRFSVDANGQISGSYNKLEGISRVGATIRGRVFTRPFAMPGATAQTIGIGHVTTPQGSIPFTMTLP